MELDWVDEQDAEVQAFPSTYHSWMCTGDSEQDQERTSLWPVGPVDTAAVGVDPPQVQAFVFLRT